MLPPLFTHVRYAWLVTASFAAGGINAVAGGGSFLSFPAMLSMGVPPVLANTTNTVAIWPGQLTSIVALKGDLRREIVPALVGCSIAGGVGGALLLLHTGQRTFLNILPWMLLAATITFGFSRRLSAWVNGRLGAATQAHPGQPARPINQWLLVMALLPICLYIGYFGAAGGLLIMALLALLGVEEMHQLNSLKVLAACTSNGCAVITFIAYGAVLWHYCLLSMVAAAIGGWVGAQYAKSLNASVLRGIVVAAGCTVSAWFFYVGYVRGQ